MNLKSLFNEQYRKKAIYPIKRILRLFKGKKHSTPVFVFGKQRSGTNMVIDVMRLHPDTEIFSENKNSEAFFKWRIRDFNTLKRLVEDSKEPFICFSPLMDSHLIEDFMTQFPNGKFVWAYRDYRDNANSALRKFPTGTRKIKAVLSNQNEAKWSWFQDGISSNTIEKLKNLYSSELSEFDFACLTWWVRNLICIELKDVFLQKIIFIKYEDLATKPHESFQLLCGKLGMRYIEKAICLVHNRSIGKNPYPELNGSVKNLCDNLMQQLDNYYLNP